MDVGKGFTCRQAGAWWVIGALSICQQVEKILVHKIHTSNPAFQEHSIQVSWCADWLS